MMKTKTPGKTTATPENVLMMKNYKPGFFKPARTIIEYEGITRTDRDAIVKLYEALVPKDTQRTINLRMMVEEAFPKFEETIGEANFTKVKKYFGIGVKKPNKGALREGEINAMIGKLRTIENAQYYITGFAELIEKIANKLGGAPEAMTSLEKAKFVRMFMVIFAGYFYFIEDCNYRRNGDTIETIINYAKVPDLNKIPFHPEELFVLYNYKLKTYSDNGIIYDIVQMEVMDLDKRTRNELLTFAELKLDPEKEFISVNETVACQTFGSVRTLKRKVHQEPGVFPMEIFTCRDMFVKIDFDDLYAVYKALRSFPLENFPTVDRDVPVYEGSRLVHNKHTCYEIIKGMEIAGPVEANRFVRLMEYAITANYNIPVRHDKDGKELPIEEVKFYNARNYLAAIKFANAIGYLDAYTEVERDYEVAEILIERDVDDGLKRYIHGEINEMQLKEILEIDDQFEEDAFGITHEAPRAPIEEIVLAFAIDNGYLEEKAETTMQLITEVVLPGNEELFEQYESGEIDAQTLEGKIGFEDEFAEMYFDAEKIDVTAIESKLQDMKRSMADKKKMQKSALAISLYCYVVEEQIPCGTKKKAPKRNKGLKPSNLKALIGKSA